MITYAIDLELNRSTPTSLRRQLLKVTEAVQGPEEFSSVFTLAASAVNVPISIGGLTKVKALIIDAKPSGGVVDLDLILNFNPTVRTGVTGGFVSLPFGSRLIILDTQIDALTITNLSATECSIMVVGLGE